MREASSCGRFSETENSSNFSSVSAAAGIRVLSESGNPAKACENDLAAGKFDADVREVLEYGQRDGVEPYLRVQIATAVFVHQRR